MLANVPIIGQGNLIYNKLCTSIPYLISHFTQKINAE